MRIVIVNDRSLSACPGGRGSTDGLKRFLAARGVAVLGSVYEHELPCLADAAHQPSICRMIAGADAIVAAGGVTDLASLLTIANGRPVHLVNETREGADADFGALKGCASVTTTGPTARAAFERRGIVARARLDSWAWAEFTEVLVEIEPFVGVFATEEADLDGFARSALAERLERDWGSAWLHAFEGEAQAETWRLLPAMMSTARTVIATGRHGALAAVRSGRSLECLGNAAYDGSLAHLVFDDRPADDPKRLSERLRRLTQDFESHPLAGLWAEAAPASGDIDRALARLDTARDAGDSRTARAIVSDAVLYGRLVDTDIARLAEAVVGHDAISRPAPDLGRAADRGELAAVRFLELTGRPVSRLRLHSERVAHAIALESDGEKGRAGDLLASLPSACFSAYRAGARLFDLGQSPLAEAFFAVCDVPWRRRQGVRGLRLRNLASVGQHDRLADISDAILREGGIDGYCALHPRSWMSRLPDVDDLVVWWAYRRRFAAGWANAAIGAALSSPDDCAPGLPLTIVFEESYGVGTMIYFARWLEGVRRYHSDVTLLAPRRTEAMFRRLGPDIGRLRLYDADDDAAALLRASKGLRLSAADLPLLGGRYGFRPETSRLFAHGPETPAEPDRTGRIGLGWWTPNIRTGALRNVDVGALAAAVHAAVPGELISLQPDPDAAREQLEAAGALDTVSVEPVDGRRDMDVYLDLVASCSLVVTIDSSIGFFAGALGVPTVVLLPPEPSVGWNGGYSRSAAFDCVRYVRNMQRGEWRATLQRLTDSLQRLAADAAASR